MARLIFETSRQLFFDHKPGQQDVQECVLGLFDKVLGSFPDRCRRRTIRQFSCTNCDFTRFNESVAESFEVDVRGAQSGIRLAALFRRLYREEVVGGVELEGHPAANLEDRVYCETCRTNTCTIALAGNTTLPEILVVYLNRGTKVAGAEEGVIDRTPVNVPQRLSAQELRLVTKKEEVVELDSGRQVTRLSLPLVEPPPPGSSAAAAAVGGHPDAGAVYDLIGVVNHVNGTTVHSGHYIAIVAKDGI